MTTILFVLLDQLWSHEGNGTLKNKKDYGNIGIWDSTKNKSHAMIELIWNLPQQGESGMVEVKENDLVIEIGYDGDYYRKGIRPILSKSSNKSVMWTRSKTNTNGYFTLKDKDSGNYLSFDVDIINSGLEARGN